MNKIKLMYDMVKAMREKEGINGTMKLRLLKGGEEVFRMDNQFSRNFSSGWGKASINTAMDYEGKQFQHDSTTEYHSKPREGRPHGCHKHHFHPGHQFGNCHEGIKERLTGIMAVLNALNNLQVEEEENKNLCLSLDLKEVPDDLKEVFRNHMMSGHHGGSKFSHGFSDIEKGSLECRIDKNYEILSITAVLEGKLQEKNQPDQDVTLNVSIVFDR